MRSKLILLFLLLFIVSCSPAAPAPITVPTTAAPARVLTATPSSTTPTAPPPPVELSSAIRQGLVTIKSATGVDLATLTLTLESNANVPLHLEIQPGSMFIPDNLSVQNMVVRLSRLVYLAPGETRTLGVDVSCANMHLDGPTGKDTFRFEGPGSPDSDLVKLLNSPAFVELSYFAQQYAIWTITDNPAAGEYLGISYGVSPITLTAEILTEIYQAFQDSGINPMLYSATAEIGKLNNTLPLLTIGPDTRANLGLHDLSPDGRLLAVAGKDFVQIWNSSDNSIVQTMRLPKAGEYREVAFSPDGARLGIFVWGGEPTYVFHVWDMVKNKLALTLMPCSDTLDYSMTGMTLVYICEHQLTLVSLSDGSQIRSVDLDSSHGPYTGISISADSKTAAVVDHDRRVGILSLETGALLFVFPRLYQQGYVDVELSPDGSSLYYAADNGPAALWNTQSGEQVSPDFRPSANQSPVNGIYSLDGRWFAFGTYPAINQAGIVLYDITQKTTSGPYTFPSYVLPLPMFSPDGTVLSYIDGEKLVRLTIP